MHTRGYKGPYENDIDDENNNFDKNYKKIIEYNDMKDESMQVLQRKRQKLRNQRFGRELQNLLSWMRGSRWLNEEDYFDDNDKKLLTGMI